MCRSPDTCALLFIKLLPVNLVPKAGLVVVAGQRITKAMVSPSLSSCVSFLHICSVHHGLINEITTSNLSSILCFKAPATDSLSSLLKKSLPTSPHQSHQVCSRVYVHWCIPPSTKPMPSDSRLVTNKRTW